MSVLASEFQGGARRRAAFGLDVAFAAGVEILTSSPSVGTIDWRGPLTTVRFTPKSRHAGLSPSHEPQVAQGIMMPGLNFPGTPAIQVH